MLKSKNRWIPSEYNPESIQTLSEQLQVSSLVAKLLSSRGLDNIEAAKNFLHMEELDFHNPFLMHDMENAVERIRKAIAEEEPILVFGDYDADGVTSTTVMMTVLHDLGANVQFYIPDRFTEGYGPNKEAFFQAKEDGIRLIITVDTGISACEEIEFANQLGMEVIITDHHEPGEKLPNALALIHPRIGEDYPFPYLAGVGVAWKVAHALYGQLPDHLLELACIGTIADLVPLQDENRRIVIEGLKKLRTTRRQGLLALFESAKVDPSTVDEETVGFTIGPRINAAGRLTHASSAVLLLLSKDSSEAKQYAIEIETLNKERQKIVQETVKDALDQVQQTHDLEKDRVIVIGSEQWNSGVIGIVASKLVQEFYRPTFVFSINAIDGTAKGSARSIQGFDLYENLTECKELLPHYGGHPMAAGMSLLSKDLDHFRQKINKLAWEKLDDTELTPVIQLDATLALEEINLKAIEEIKRLAPFGVQNPKPKILIKNVSLGEIRRIGADKNHLKMAIGVDDPLDVIAFGSGDLAEEMSPFSSIDIVGELSINEWNNRRKPQLMMQDVRINHWQLFDWRGIRGIHENIAALPEKSRKIILFNPDSTSLLQDTYRDHVCMFQDVEFSSDDYVVLLDLPQSSADLFTLFNNQAPSRIYVHFSSMEEHFFQTIPTREHFKWFYGFLLKNKTLDLNKYGITLAKKRGWTTETIQFISKVFFELEFVTINNGVVSINPTKQKRDLTDSPTYQSKVKRADLEKELVYSSYGELKAYFEKLFFRDEKAREEVTWI